MSYSEDPSSPAAPFSGDSTGQIFELPDMVAASVTTTERVVDTQSGFLIVVKRLTDKLSLSVKRRIGTPPASSVSLTPDESLKLSRILSSSVSTSEEDQAEPQIEKMESPRAIRRRNAARLSSQDDGEITIPDLVVPTHALQSTKMPMKLMLMSVLRAFMIPVVGLVLTIFAIGFGLGVSSDKMISAKPPVMADPLAADPLNSKKVDSFVRDFVSRMLDFSAKTYRLSQVQAMATMSPDLLERYWQETRFPLSKKQLAALPPQTSIMITELKQERVDQSTVQVDIKAMLSDPQNPKIVTPVNLSLKLASGEDGQIVVTDQQDISAATGK